MVGRRRWRIAILLGIGVLINYFDRVNLSVAHDALHDEFGISNTTYGYLLSAYVWTYATLQLPIGVLLDRFGVRLIGRISAFLWSVASFAAAAATSIVSFFGARLLLGIGEAPTFPANAKAIGYWFPGHERSLATAFFDSAAKLASAIGVPLIGAAVIAFGWRISFALTGVISFLFFIAFYFIYRDPKDDPGLTDEELHYIRDTGSGDQVHTGESQPAPLSYLLRQRKVLGLVAGFFAYNYCFYLFLTWLPSYFSALHMNLQHSILFTSVPWIFATITGVVVGGWLVDRLIQRGHDQNLVRKTVLISGTVLGLAVAGAMFTRDAVIATCWISISLGGLSAASPVGWSITSLIAPRDSVGKVAGILNFGNQLAGIVAPIATGYFAGPSNSFSRAFAAASIILLLGICGYVFLLGRIEPVPAPPTI
jgi:ACS family D-galactonate transporter-like MFS transporter